MRNRRHGIGILICLIGALVILPAVLIGITARPATPAGESTAAPTESEPTESEPTAPSETAAPAQAGWHEENGIRYYLGHDGARVTGWLEEDGRRYWFDDDGVLQTGRIRIGGSTYLLGADGALLGGGWAEYGENRYYLNADGSVYTGWLELEGSQYYLRSDGTMAVGQTDTDVGVRFFTSAGVHVLMPNPWNFIPGDYQPTLVALSDDIGEDQWVEESCYEDLVQMITDCNAAMASAFSGSGEYHEAYVVSSYRTMEHQTNNYNNRVAKEMSRDPSLTLEEARRKAATVVAYPGTSEHQLGLAVDIIDTALWALNSQQAELPAQRWLMENCWRYGFILRYPSGSTDSTGIIHEPWHYRYVGPELARELESLGFPTLEEYFAGITRA